MVANGKKHIRGKTSKKTNEVKAKKSLPEIKPTLVSTKSQKKEKNNLTIRKAKKIIFTFFTILGVFFGVYSFYPRMSIQETQLLDPEDPFYYPFNIVNNGNINLENFSYELKVSGIDMRDGNSLYNSIIERNVDNIPRIKVNGHHPIDLSKHVGISGFFIEKAEVFIRYQYSIPIIKLHFSDSTKFILLNKPKTGYKWTEYQY